MRLFISKAAAPGLCVCALLLLLAACSPQDGSAPASAAAGNSGDNTTAQTTKPTPAPPADDTRRISIEETQAAIANGSALIVDVREEGSYKASHIKGAKSIPLAQFEKRIGELPTDKLIITYCA